MLQPFHFALESLGERTFPGFSQGHHWNGWECPAFSFDTAQQIARALGEFQNAFYDAAADAFVIESDGDEEIYPAVLTETGDKVYPLGAGVWMWEKSTTAVGER